MSIRMLNMPSMLKCKKLSQTKILRIQALSLIKSNKSIAFKSKTLGNIQVIIKKFNPNKIKKKKRKISGSLLSYIFWERLLLLFSMNISKIICSISIKKIVNSLKFKEIPWKSGKLLNQLKYIGKIYDLLHKKDSNKRQNQGYQYIKICLHFS